MKTAILLILLSSMVAAGQTKWGMSIDEVIQTEGVNIRWKYGEHDSLRFIHYKTNLEGLKYDRIFYFLNDSLVMIDMMFSEALHHRHYMNRYRRVENILFRNFGPGQQQAGVLVTVRQTDDALITHAIMLEESHFNIGHHPLHRSITHMIELKKIP